MIDRPILWRQGRVLQVPKQFTPGFSLIGSPLLTFNKGFSFSKLNCHMISLKCPAGGWAAGIFRSTVPLGMEGVAFRELENTEGALLSTGSPSASLVR